jgi:hypothetical protein
MPFSVTIDLSSKSRRSQVQLSGPQCFNLVVPEVILEERLRTDRHTVEECYRRYTEILFHRWRNQLAIRKQPVLLYSGKDPARQQTLLARLRVKAQEQRVVKRAQEGSRPLIEPECTAEKYCVCKRPYYFYLVKSPLESEEEYADRVKDNAMISCSKCSEWFHLGCIHYPGTHQQADADDFWICPQCSSKAGVRTRSRRGIISI